MAQYCEMAESGDAADTETVLDHYEGSRVSISG